MFKKVTLAAICVTALVAGTLIQKGSSQSWKDKLNKNIEKKMKKGVHNRSKTAALTENLLFNRLV